MPITENLPPKYCRGTLCKQSWNIIDGYRHHTITMATKKPLIFNRHSIYFWYAHLKIALCYSRPQYIVPRSSRSSFWCWLLCSFVSMATIDEFLAPLTQWDLIYFWYTHLKIALFYSRAQYIVPSSSQSSFWVWLLCLLVSMATIAGIFGHPFLNYSGGHVVTPYQLWYFVPLGKFLTNFLLR